MTVSELIAVLSTFDPNAEAVITPSDTEGVSEYYRSPAAVFYDPDPEYPRGIVEIVGVEF